MGEAIQDARDHAQTGMGSIVEGLNQHGKKVETAFTRVGGQFIEFIQQDKARREEVEAAEKEREEAEAEEAAIIRGRIDDNKKTVKGHKERINRVRTRAKVLTDRVKGDCNDKTMDARITHIEKEASTEADKAAIERSYQEAKAEQDRRRLAANYASMRPSERALARRRLMNRPKSHIVVLEQRLEEINRLN